MTSLLIRRLRTSAAESGATAVEYALMVSLIALVIIVSVAAIGVNLSTFFNDAGTRI